MGVWSFEMEQGLGVQSRRTIRQPWASLTYGNRTFFGPSSDFREWTGLQPRSHSGVLACVGIWLARHLWPYTHFPGRSLLGSWPLHLQL